MGEGSKGEGNQGSVLTAQFRPEEIITRSVPFSEPCNPRLPWAILWHVQILQRPRWLPDGQRVQIQARQEAGGCCRPVLLLTLSLRGVAALLPYPMIMTEGMDALHPYLRVGLEALPPDDFPLLPQASCYASLPAGLEALPPDGRPLPGRTTEAVPWATGSPFPWTCSPNSKSGVHVHADDTCQRIGSSMDPRT